MACGDSSSAGDRALVITQAPINLLGKSPDANPEGLSQGLKKICLQSDIARIDVERGVISQLRLYVGIDARLPPCNVLLNQTFFENIIGRARQAEPIGIAMADEHNPAYLSFRLLQGAKELVGVAGGKVALLCVSGCNREILSAWKPRCTLGSLYLLGGGRRLITSSDDNYLLAT
jgi:hypothetical protein